MSGFLSENEWQGLTALGLEEGMNGGEGVMMLGCAEDIWVP